MVCVLDYEAGNPGSIPVSGGTTNWLFSAGCNLTGYCYQQYQPRLDNQGSIDRHLGLCWKQVVPYIPGGDFRRLPTLN